jgi:hypothetical protein
MAFNERCVGPYIVRQQAFVFVAFVFAGGLFCVFPWLVSQVPTWMKLGCSGMGLLALFAGIWGWRVARIGLIADRHGLWLAGYSFTGKRLVPWDSVIAVKKVSWNSPEGEHTDVVIGLRSVESHPAREMLQWHSTHFDGEADDDRFRIPLPIGHDEWDWEPDVFVQWVQQCIQSPISRLSLGEYTGSRGS